MEWDVKPSCHLAVKKARMVHEQKSPASRQGFLRPSETGMDISEEPVDKPGSVVDSHPSRTPVTRCLEQPTREPIRAACGLEKPMFPYLALLQVGFAVPLPLPAARCALTAPFHPCRHPMGVLGGLFSVALSVGSRPPGVTWHLALRSPDFPPHPLLTVDEAAV